MRALLCFSFAGLFALASGLSFAETISGLDGRVKLEPPASWKSVPPKSRIVEYEFQAPGVDGADPARVTFMASGGSLKDNIDRWIGQFNAGAKTNQEKMEVAGREVHIVEISGTYKETMGGPFSGGKVVEQPNYSMLGGIVVDPEGPKFFAKMIGASATIEAQKESFKKMLKELKTN
jgi:gluconolactonase